MFEDTYKTIAKPSEGSYSEKRSKFLAYAFPVQNEQEVKQRLAEIQKKHWDARHHCYAYILGPHKDAYRLNDNVSHEYFGLSKKSQKSFFSS